MLTIKNRVGKGLIVFLALSTLLTGCAPPGPRALFEGKRLVEQGKYPQAVERLKAATSLLSTNAQAYNYLGLAYHHAGQFNEAEKAYRQALYLNRNLAEVHYNLGCLWLEQNHLDKAKPELTAYTLSRGNSVEGLVKLGTVQLRSRELSAAEGSFKEALRFGPQNPEAWNGLGLVRLYRNQPGEAAQSFAGALKEQPHYRPALLNWAIVSQQYLRDRQTALQKYREYLALKPAPANAEAVTAVVRQLEQEINVAPHAVATNAAVQINPPAPPPKPPATSVARIAGTAKVEPATSVPKPIPAAAVSRPAPAAHGPKPVLEAAPATAGNLEMVTLPAEPVLKAAEDVTTASVRSQTAAVEPLAGTSPSPSAAGSKVAKRSLLQRMNPLGLFGTEETVAARPTPLPTTMESGAAAEAPLPAATAGARYDYKSPGRPAPGNRAEAERSFARGVQAQKGRRLTEAAQAYRAATQLDPSFFDAFYNLGLAASEAGNLRAALVAYETALAIQPESVDTRYNFALVLKQANYGVDSVNELEKLLATYPNETRAHLALGNLYAQQFRQPAKARQHYLKVLELDPRHPQAGAIRYWLADNRQ